MRKYSVIIRDTKIIWLSFRNQLTLIMLYQDKDKYFYIYNMGIIFKPPSVTLEQLKIDTINIDYTSDFHSLLRKNIDEYSRHYFGVHSYEMNEQQKINLFPMYNGIGKLYEKIDKAIKSDQDLGVNGLEVLKNTLVNLILDLITFLEDNNLEDRSVGDIEII